MPWGSWAPVTAGLELPGTMEACSPSICVTQRGFSPNKDHLALSLLSVSAYSQKSKAALLGKVSSLAVHGQLGRGLGGSDSSVPCPGQAVPLSVHRPSPEVNLLIFSKALGFSSSSEQTICQASSQKGAFYLILTKAPRKGMAVLYLRLAHFKIQLHLLPSSRG